MKKIIFLSILSLIFLQSHILANENNCKEFKKFSVEYMKCKTALLKEKTIKTTNKIKDKTIETGENIKNKTISTSKNIIKDTKDYQNEEWSEQKEKIKKVKEKVLD